MSKRFILFLLLGCSSILLMAQGDEIIPIKNIPSEGILLNGGWKYHLGDNPEWAKEDYQDHSWEAVDPAQDIHALPMLWKDSIVWFRLHLNVDAAWIGDLAMTVTQAGASEFYLNGHRFRGYGVVSRNADEIVAVNPYERPVPFPIIKAGHQLLAIRYVLKPGIRYTTEWANQNLGLNIKINSFDNANVVYHDTRINDDKNLAFRISAYIILAILYLAFFVSDRRQRTSLYFFIYALIWALVWSTLYYTTTSLPSIHYLYYICNGVLVIQIIGWFFCLTAIYELLDQRRGWIFNLLFIFGIICIPLGLFIYPWGWSIYAALFITLANFDITRIAFLASRQGKEGARIMVTGCLLCLFFWVLFISFFYNLLPVYINPRIIFALNHLSIPVAVCIYLGYDFARTNRSLEQKLKEVKDLSAEKTQILSAQNEMLEQQVTERTAELTQSLNDLRSTQAQLIQSEKMASLGELTAGIAHEIQNPLNFVNNFSEVNAELLAEMRNEMNKGNIDDAKAIANDIIDNEQKINHHGKRADAIVKGMLQHSQNSSGVKESTDINKLADEYLRLAYHGFRSKDKSFNATLIPIAIGTAFDESIGNINIIPQDIGRVLLNLYNNAFYAVSQKHSSTGSALKEIKEYEPTVSISTKKINDKVEIKVGDNGNGIPQKIVDKIFQPFFTTKPTGQGTGLGLSLAYDIVKAHGGQIKVESKEGQGSAFIIHLPTNHL